MTQTARTAAPAPAGAAPATGLQVAGIYISLSATAVATPARTTTINPSGSYNDTLNVRHRRFQWIARDVFAAVGDCNLAVLNAPANKSSGAWDLGGLWWLLVDGLIDRGIPIATVSPQCWPLYATGAASAGKDAVTRAVQQTYGVLPAANHYQATAVCLRAMGHDWARRPLAHVPDLNRIALLGCTWPDPAEVTR